MAKLDDYKDIWGDDFEELVRMFRAGVTPELENLLIGIVDSMVFDAKSFAAFCCALTFALVILSPNIV